MYEEAKKKIKEEIKANEDNDFVKVIGEYVLKNIEVNKATAKGIVSGKKTIDECCKVMKEEAEKRIKQRKGHQCVVLSDEEGFALVRKYFELEGVQTEIEERLKEVEEVVIKESATEKLEHSEFNVSLEDFM